MDKFIPKEKVDRNKSYPDYIATSRGLVHRSIASTKHGADGRLLYRQILAPMPGGDIWGIEPSKRRSPQERVSSLAQRIQYQNEKTGLPASVYAHAQTIMDKVGTEGLSDDVIREIQALAANGGRLMSAEDCRAMAQVYITEAEKNWNEQQDKRVTRQSPYALDRPSPG